MHKTAELNCQQTRGPHQESCWLASSYLPGPAWQNPSQQMNVQYPNRSSWTRLCSRLGTVWGDHCCSTLFLSCPISVSFRKYVYEEEMCQKSISAFIDALVSFTGSSLDVLMCECVCVSIFFLLKFLLQIMTTHRSFFVFSYVLLFRLIFILHMILIQALVIWLH